MLCDVGIICYSHAHGINFTLTECQKDNKTMTKSVKWVWMEGFP